MAEHLEIVRGAIAWFVWLIVWFWLNGFAVVADCWFASCEHAHSVELVYFRHLLDRFLFFPLGFSLLLFERNCYSVLISRLSIKVCCRNFIVFRFFWMCRNWLTILVFEFRRRVCVKSICRVIVLFCFADYAIKQSFFFPKSGSLLISEAWHTGLHSFDVWLRFL